MRKKDVYPLDPLSGLRTNQQLSSFKLKNHTETKKKLWFWLKSMVFTKIQKKTMVFRQKICGFHQNPWFSTKSTDFQLRNPPKSADFILQDHEV